MMIFSFKIVDFAFKTMDFVLKNDEFRKADDVSWLSWGCGLPPTNATTNKNYYAAGNILLGAAPISVGGVNSTDGAHVCCNNVRRIQTRNVVLNTRSCVSKTRNVAFKMMNFADANSQCRRESGRWCGCGKQHYHAGE